MLRFCKHVFLACVFFPFSFFFHFFLLYSKNVFWRQVTSLSLSFLACKTMLPMILTGLLWKLNEIKDAKCLDLERTHRHNAMIHTYPPVSLLSNLRIYKWQQITWIPHSVWVLPGHMAATLQTYHLPSTHSPGVPV